MWVLPGQPPAAYCLPGDDGVIVVSSSAFSELTRAQLGAVIAHEHAHLRQRHHLLMGWVEVVAAAFPAVPLARAVRSHIARLIELAADDRACRSHSSSDLATALATMALAGSPAVARGALATARGAPAASSSNPIERVIRLLEPAPRPTALRRVAACAAVAVTMGTVGLLVAVTMPAATVLADAC